MIKKFKDGFIDRMGDSTNACATGFVTGYVICFVTFVLLGAAELGKERRRG